MDTLREQIARLIHLRERSGTHPPFPLSWECDKELYRTHFLAVADEIIYILEQAGYLPVEPVKQEVLTPEELKFLLQANENDDYVVTEGDKAISQATCTYNEAKGQLYRVRGNE